MTKINNNFLFPVGGAMTITHNDTYMSSGLDSYPACDIWSRSDYVKSSYNSLLCHVETSKFTAPPQQRREKHKSFTI